MKSLSKEEEDILLDNLYNTAIASVRHVGQANYAHRERQALKALQECLKTGLYVDPNEVKDV